MRRRSLPILAASLGAVLATAGAASAADFCVDRGGCDAGRTFTGDLQAALNAAAAFSGADRVLIGPGTYARTGAAGFTYDATSPVEIAGNPGEATIIATGPGLGADGAALTVVNGPHVVRDLDVFVGTADRRGVRFAGSVMRDVLVTNEVGIAAQGVVMGGSAALEHVQVVQEGAAGADAVLAPCACTIRDSGISTDGTGIRLSGSQAVVERTRIRAAVGLSADSGGAAVRDSVIRPVGDDGVGARARNAGAGTDAIRISLSRVTIAGDGAAGQTGVSAAADDGTETASVTVEGGIITGVAVPVRREAAGGRSANVTLRWTNVPATGNVDQNTSGGTGAIDASDHVTTHPATFVNPVQGDFTPQAGSPLIDAGDPAQALTGVTDLVGTVRALDGDGDGSAVVDLGAVEAPAVAVTTPTVTTPEDPGTGTTTTPTVTSSAPVDLTPPRLRGGLLLKPTLRLRVSVAEAATVTIRLQRLAGTRWVNTGAVIRRTTTRRTLLTVPLTVPRIRARYRVVVTAADRSGNTFLLRGARVRLGVR